MCVETFDPARVVPLQAVEGAVSGREGLVRVATGTGTQLWSGALCSLSQNSADFKGETDAQTIGSGGICVFLGTSQISGCNMKCLSANS